MDPVNTVSVDLAEVLLYSPHCNKHTYIGLSVLHCFMFVLTVFVA